MGFTRGKNGNWTSWPPHEHAANREEIYLVYDMPAPAFGVQFAYTDPENMEFCEVVRDGDAIVIPRGYHQNVGAPGCGMGIWGCLVGKVAILEVG